MSEQCVVTTRDGTAWTCIEALADLPERAKEKLAAGTPGGNLYAPGDALALQVTTTSCRSKRRPARCSMPSTGRNPGC